MADGFSASRAPSTIATGTQLNNWTTTAPYYPGAGFDPTTGTYTVPVTGRYAIKATISYTTVASIGIQLGSTINPSFVVRRTSDGTDLITGLFPLLNTSITLLTLRVILGNATVTMAGDVTLNAGDTIAILYVSTGLTINLNLGGPNASATVWSMHRLT